MRRCVAGLYALVQLIGTPRALVAMAGLVAIYPLATLLSPPQLLPGLSAAGESVRSGGVSYEFCLHVFLSPGKLPYARGAVGFRRHAGGAVLGALLCFGK